MAAEQAAQAAQAQRQARCSSFGYQPGTPDYSQCLERMYVADQQQIAAQQAQQAAALDGLGTSLQRAGAALQQAGTPPPGVMAPPPNGAHALQFHRQYDDVLLTATVRAAGRVLVLSAVR
jgi:hypothetical protein